MSVLSGKTALITGATGNLGQAVTQRLLEAGAQVTATYMRAEEAAKLREHLGGQYGEDRLVTERVDVTQEQEVALAVKGMVDRWGRVDILCNLVGGFMSPTPVAELSLGEWEKQMALNLTSAFLCSRAVAPVMTQAGWGRIISISSRRGAEPAAGYSAYACAKAGVITLTQTLSEELKHQGVTVNCILPSVIDTPVTRAAMPKVDPAKLVAPAQIAALIEHLCSGAAAALTGAAIPLYNRM